MFIEILLLIFIGIGLGIFAGLVPGIHVNTMVPLVLSLSFLIPNTYYLAVLIVATAVTEMFIDYIPSIYLGAPEADTSLSVLPGHRLLLDGRGYEAIKLTVIGGIGCLVVSLIMITLLASYFQSLYELSRPYIHYLIILVILFMIFSEKKPKKILFSVLIISISGLLGVLVLNSSIVNQQESLFPTLTGLFGLSTIIVSISERTKIPAQVESFKLNISRFNLIKSIILGSLAGLLVGFLPAIGISEAATMVQYLGGSGDARSFLVSVSGINVANDAFSLVSLYLVNNPRSGASVAIQKLLTGLTLFDVILLIGVILISTGIATILTLYLGKKIPKYLEKVNYRTLSWSVVIFLICMIFIMTGPFGLLIAFTSTSIGLLCAYLEIRRSHCMGVLLIPSILFFTGLSPAIIGVLGI